MASHAGVDRSRLHEIVESANLLWLCGSCDEEFGNYREKTLNN